MSRRLTRRLRESSAREAGGRVPRWFARFGRRATWGAPGRALWRWSSGRTPSGDRRSTAQFLLGRMLLLPAVAFTVLALAATAYFDLQDRTEQLRDRYAPALVELTHARVSLTLAQHEAELRLGRGDHGLPAQIALVGLGERYPALLTEASQSLNNVAQTKALRKAQEQEVRVISGLVVAYDGWINWANSHYGSDVLRKSGMEYAAGVLGKDTGPIDATAPALLDRIRSLEKALRADVDDLSAWSALPVGAASAALLAALVFTFTVVGTLSFVRGQLRIRSSLLTVYAVPVLLVLVVLAFGAIGQHEAQRYVRDTAKSLGRISVPPASEGGIKNQIRSEIKADNQIEDKEELLAANLRDTHPGAWTSAAGLALALAAATTVACGFTLFHYGRRHLAIHWRSP
ncbi:hypothetical protein [Streptomyces scopuliridis]|uniref:Uncharacterized protein n=1 Tax=Streptomyces scopuliridis RB72 TaxID=1440053 RepID=A0A2T7T7G4_9ACTN|nr:hypothetical protein [Streptomyces scopuliridis]PVE11094.1 hypothetical protein Y717_17660 [Streptomyces scopuliridis RB72]